MMMCTMVWKGRSWLQEGAIAPMRTYIDVGAKLDWDKLGPSKLAESKEHSSSSSASSLSTSSSDEFQPEPKQAKSAKQAY